MIQEHRGRLPLYHIDLYRLEEVGLDDMGLREYLFFAGIAAVEWFERLREGPDWSFYRCESSTRIPTRAASNSAPPGSCHAAIVAKLKNRFA